MLFLLAQAEKPIAAPIPWAKFLPFMGLGGMLVLVLILLPLGKTPLAYNLRNLQVRWKTTLLTAAAFMLVVGLTIVMLSFIRGMQKLTEQSGQPGNVIVLADGSTDEQFSTLGYVDTGDVERQPGVLKDSGGRLMCSKEVFVVVNQPAEVGPGEKPRRRFIQVRGMDDPDLAGLVHGISLKPGGNWFSPSGVADSPNPDQESNIQAVIGQGLAAELGNDRPDKKPLAPGDTFQLGPRKWVVTGVLESLGSTFDSEVWGKHALVGKLFGKETYSSIVLRTKGDPEAKALAQFLNKDYKKASLNAQTELEYFSKLGETAKQFLFAVYFIAAIMAVGGVFGVMNTMFAAVNQRRKDVGVLRILGYRRRHVLISFLLESLAIALIGGLLGCLLGFCCNGVTLKSVVSSGQGGGKTVVLQLAVTMDILMSGLLLSLLMGFLGGLVPSLTTVRLRALESLR